MSGFVILLYTSFWLVSGWLFLFMVIAVLELIRFLERDRRSLHNFLIAINQNDFMGNVGVSGDQKFLSAAYRELSRKYHQIATEKEANHLFLNMIVENTGIPMIAYKEENEEVVLINEGAKELFSKPYFRYLSSIGKLDPGLYQSIINLKDHEKTLHRLSKDGHWKELTIVARRLKLRNEWFKLIALQNIKSELDERELESWQKLIRVLTHEIKNSVIPISTLTEVIHSTLQDENGNPIELKAISPDDEDDLRNGLQTISKRSKGLVTFVNSYSNIAKIPTPHFQLTNLNQLISDVCTLQKEYAAGFNIHIEHSLPETPVQAMIDPDLFEQVLINLIKNGIEAQEHEGLVKIELIKTADEIIISVHDNGPGIDPEVFEHIFIPFYTTKKDGSGIGLSLSRQITRKHNGELQASTQAGKGSTFTVILPTKNIIS